MRNVSKTFMAIARFKPGVAPEDIRALIPAEQAQAKLLTEQGLIGDIKVAMPRRTVFIEAFAASEEAAAANLETLPLAKLWEIDLFETTPPAGAPVS